MATVTIGTPANSGDPLPATISGSYDLAGGPPIPPGGAKNAPADAPAPVIIAVIVSASRDYTSDALPVTITPTSGTTGTWTCSRPGGLASSTDYLVVATLSYGPATDTDMKHSLTY